MFNLLLGLSSLAEKTASTARLARYILSLQKKDIAVPDNIKKVFRDKMQSSASRLVDTIKNRSDKADVLEKFKQIGKTDKYVESNLRGLSNLASTKSTHIPLSYLLTRRNNLSSWGQDFAKIRQNIPRNYWASKDEINAVKQEIRKIVKQQNWDPNTVPINIHRRLFKAKDPDGFGISDAGFGSYGTTFRNGSRASADINGALSQSRANIFLHPVDDSMMQNFRNYVLPTHLQTNISDNYLRRLLANHTVWHEGGHLVDPRSRVYAPFSGSVLGHGMANARQKRETFATLFGNQGLFRSPNSNNNTVLQDFAKSIHRVYPHGQYKGPDLPSDFRFAHTQNNFSAVNNIFRQIYGN